MKKLLARAILLTPAILPIRVMLLIRTILPMLIMAVTVPASLHAQFFKNILNTVKQTGQNRANDKASQVTNKAIDKADPMTKTKPGGTVGTTGSAVPGDTAATNRVLGAFVKAAADNPNDTSSADLTMKALGLLVSGGGVSAEDSAAAIASYRTATGGSGYFYRYVTTAGMKGKQPSRDTSLSYMTSSGYGRKEMRINMPGAMGGKMITIGHASQAKYSISLDPDNRTYSLTIIDSSLINSGRENYQVTKIGSETVQGFACTHVRLISTSGSGMFKSSTTMELWTSTAVPGYSFIRKIQTMQNIQPRMMQALDSAGAGGSIVKMETSGKDYFMSMLLVSAEEKTFPESLFIIPSGYTESKQNMMFRMMSGAKKQ